MTTRIGEAWLLLTGAAALLLLFLPFSPWTLLLALPVLYVGRASARPKLTRWNLIDLFTLTLIAGYTKLALAAPPIENDYLLIWGVKAKEFFFARGIDWAWLESPLNHTAHPDYPILLPLVYDAFALLTGGWNDRWIGIITVAYGVAALLIVRGMLADELPKPWRAAATAALMPLVFSPYVGLAEAPLIAYSLAGVLFIRRGEPLRGAIYLGLAAFTKNEGLTLVIAAAFALVLAKRAREAVRLWPAILIPLPWLVLRTLHGLQTDLLVSGIAERFLARLADPWPVFAAMARYPAGSLLFWLGVVVLCVLGWRSIVAEERFLAATIVLQLLFFIGAYFVSPRDLDWHVQWSWERIVRQLMPAVVLLALFAGRSANQTGDVSGNAAAG
ncbi:MAG TPA: hypothetical protein VEO54_20090 [Thermoanaerobaculia bacterium]|nr:hypothetical protein [Thermoanaerobaculia bacterium]